MNVDLALGVLFFLLATGATLTMLKVQGATGKDVDRSGLMKFHRLMGRLYGVVYLVLMWRMWIKAGDYPSLNALQALHVALGLAIAPILLIKVLLIRNFPRLKKSATGLGITLFCVTFVMLLLGAGPRMWQKGFEEPEDATPEQIVAAGKELVEQRCQKCHALDQVYDHRGKKTKALWESTFDRMDELDGGGLADVRKPIVAYLQAELSAAETPEGVKLTGAALLEARCAKCHTLDRAYEPTKTLDGWRTTVKRYAELLPDHIEADEVEPIAQFLFSKRGIQLSPEEQKAAEQKKIFEEHCGRCHNLSRSTDYAQENQLEARDWRRIIRRMERIAKERELPVWTREQAKVIGEYLASLVKDGG